VKFTEDDVVRLDTAGFEELLQLVERILGKMVGMMQESWRCK
jgi:hypothetical protein